MSGQNYWIIEIYSDDTANVSIMSEEEAQALKDMNDLEEWQWDSADEVDEEEMIERAEEHGFEHDPW